MARMTKEYGKEKIVPGCQTSFSTLVASLPSSRGTRKIVMLEQSTSIIGETTKFGGRK